MLADSADSRHVEDADEAFVFEDSARELFVVPDLEDGTLVVD